MAAPPITERHLHHFHRRSPIKESVRVATTANITIATALNNGDVLDGITLATDDRVLVKDQTAPAENGLYVVAASPARAYDQSTDDPAFGFLVYVRSGTVGGGSLWRNTNTSTPTIGTTGLTFAQITSASSGALPWFNVTAYGAVNDRATNDRTAINLAIAALNTAGRGVLYFPGGPGYATTGGGLTAITANALILGDGASEDGSLSGTGADSVTQIISDSSTAVLFDLTGHRALMRGMLIRNTAATPSAGAGIRVMNSTYSRVNFEDVVVRGFYDCIDSQTNANWYMSGCMVYAPVRYGLRIRNTINVDAGDWTITSSLFAAAVRTSDAAIRMESSGGGKIVGCKINTGGSTFTTGIDVAIGTGSDTSILIVDGTSIENVTGDAIRVVTTGTGRFGHIIIDGVQVGLYTNNTGRAVKLSAANTGSYPAAGTIGIVSIDGGVFYTNGTARAAVELVNADNIVLGDFAIAGFTSRYTSSGATNITDSSSIDYAESADLAAVGETVSAGVSTEIPRADHVHTITDGAVMNAGYWDVVVSGSAPPVAVSTPSDDDWVVAWVNI